MARNNAEDFTKEVKQQLRDRVANLCSNPDCRVLTVATKESSLDKADIIGEGAHICAVQPNGARYDSSMTSEQRKSFDNGIWLCRNCHKRVDGEPEKYSVELLREWKQATEKYSVDNMGHRPKNDEDIEIACEKAQHSLLKGMSFPMKTEAIQNIHNNVQKTLEKLDPRFTIHSNYTNGKTSFVIQPNADEVEVKFSIEMNDGSQPLYEELFKHGKPVYLKNIRVCPQFNLA